MNNDPRSHEIAEAVDGRGGEGLQPRIALMKFTRVLKQTPGPSPNSRPVTVDFGAGPPPPYANLASNGPTITARHQAVHIATKTLRLCDMERRS